MTLTNAIVRRACAIVILAGLASCSKRDEASVAIEQARIQLAALEHEHVASVDRLKAVAGDLQVALNSSNKATKGAAHLLESGIHLRLAEPVLSRIGDLERDSAEAVAEIRRMLDGYEKAATGAMTAEAFDPRPERAAIESEIRTRNEEIARASARRAEIDREISTRRADADALLEEASGMRNRAGRLELDSSSVSAVEAAELIRQAREFTRQADALELEARSIEAEIAKLQPDAAEMELIADNLGVRLDQHNQAMAELEQRIQRKSASASEARQRANAAAAEIDQALATLEDMRNQDLASTYDEARSILNKASSAASAAREQERTAAMLTMGHAQQALAQLEWDRSRGHQTFAFLLDELGDTSLPNASRYADLSSETKADSQEALDQAVAAIESAQSNYTGSGAKGEARERIEMLNELFEAIRQHLSEAEDGLIHGSFDVEFGSVSRDRGSDDGYDDSMDGGSGESGARDAAVALLEALQARDTGAMRRLTYAGDLSDAQLDAFFDVTEASFRLDRAMTDAFGSSMLNPGGGNGIDDASPSGITVREDGDRATVSMGATMDASGSDEIQFVNVDGVWLADLTADIGVDATEALGLVGAEMANVMRETAAAIESGEHDSIQAAIQAMGMKMMMTAGPILEQNGLDFSALQQLGGG